MLARRSPSFRFIPANRRRTRPPVLLVCLAVVFALLGTSVQMASADNARPESESSGGSAGGSAGGSSANPDAPAVEEGGGNLPGEKPDPIVTEDEAAKKPKQLDFVQAAAVPLAALTAWQGLFDQGGLKAGQRVLIHGGAGGVGHFAIQFAKARGAWVATTVSGKDMDLAHQLGADQPIDYKAEKFEDAVKDIDLVYDLIAGETQKRSFAVLKDGGTLISTLQKPDEAELARRHARGAHYLAKPNAAQLSEIATLIDAGTVRVVIDAIYPLEQAARAHRHMEDDHIAGKVVLQVAA